MEATKPKRNTRPAWLGTTSCVHCHVRTAWKSGRLCFHCHANMIVRRNYVKAQNYNNYLPGETEGPLPTPTAALPGTVEKFMVLCARAAAGQQLFHPLDARNTDDGPGIPAQLFSFGH